MSNWLYKAVGLSLVMAGATQSASAAGDQAIALVNGKPVQRAFAEAMVKERAAVGQQSDEPAQRLILDRLIGNELFVQEALRRGLDKDPEFVLKTEMVRRDLLANAFSQAYLRDHPVGEDLVKEEYERRKLALVGAKDYNLRHILVQDQAAAAELIAKLASGADFAALAKERSLDLGGSRERGGSLGWISIETGEKALISTAATLARGAYAPEPVQTRFGWHVVKLEDVRELQVLPFDAVKERLRQQLQLKRLEQLERDLRESAIVSMPQQK
jgi:peptidyl-prolyl cis-trans isomerase C